MAVCRQTKGGWTPLLNIYHASFSLLLEFICWINYYFLSPWNCKLLFISATMVELLKHRHGIIWGMVYSGDPEWTQGSEFLRRLPLAKLKRHIKWMNSGVLTRTWVSSSKKARGPQLYSYLEWQAAHNQFLLNYITCLRKFYC